MRVRRVRAMRVKMMARARVAWARGGQAGRRAGRQAGRCWSQWAARYEWAAGCE